ncbi:SGNH/GDSL hydrolase family protein [Seonamhaeicola algicola]|uniref:SGNH/GDSL hydrolase family protein n=1 Tax=Seonamhaeicola algicola TaxID=1719036 RepID=A0A5C7AZ39_9FLAO|nr:SGNH/GDSL hydrolase family protein [Seonamhaeicola algicola]TXE12963.1 SGNH/GDSL hydrolase family protein [Seonamhaeicola algicola]
MKRLLFLTTLLVIISCSKNTKQTNLPLHNKKILILGNSITQHGGYVDFLEYYLRKNYPTDTLNIISIGLSSETASGDSEAAHAFPRPCIHNRLNNALQKTKPDVVLACYGMNDGIYSELDSTRFNNYKNGILKLKNDVEATDAKLILITPTPFDASRKNVVENRDSYSYIQPYAKYNNVLDTYANWLTHIENVQVINLHTYMNTKLKLLKETYPDSTFIPDGIHPNKVGHFYMAKKILNDLYPEISIDNATNELNDLQNNTLFKLVKLRRAIRSNGWLKYVGYIKKDTVKLKNIIPTEKHVNDLNLKISEILKTNN